MPPTAMTPTGRVLKYHSNYYTVAVESDEDDEKTLFTCLVKGLLKKEGQEILVGDDVLLDAIDPMTLSARICDILPRRSELGRPKIANIDQALIVMAIRDPAFSFQQLDRYMTQVLLSGIDPIICISKSDLAETPEEKSLLQEIQTLYADTLGYPVLQTSIHETQCIEPLLSLLNGKISVLCGQSGAGKSSLLNQLNPHLQLRVGEVSQKSSTGQHTTRHVELLEVIADTYIADTPGFSHLKFDTVLPEDIETVFVEFTLWRGACRFSNCLHIDEEGCAILPNIEPLAESRYQSYQTLIAEAKCYKTAQQNSSQKEEYGHKMVSRKGQNPIKILKLKDRARASSRRRDKQQLHTWEKSFPPNPEDQPEI